MVAGVLTVVASTVAPVFGKPLEITFDHTLGGQPLAFGPEDHRPLEVTRLDYLLSGLAFQRDDGSWAESRDWFAFISAGRQLESITIDTPPEGSFQAIRFNVGLPAAVNASDPNRYSPGHPLHPQHNKLHWGWQGGYVFLAIEGRHQRDDKAPGAFTYHLANDENLMPVRIPASFSTSRPTTIRLQLPVERILGDVDIAADGETTHSRPGDDLAARLRDNVIGAFSVAEIANERFQKHAPGLLPGAPRLPGSGATPYPLRISTRLPMAPLPEDNPLTAEGVSLGRRLFEEQRLSMGNRQSCASCHQRDAAFSDSGRTFSVGAGGSTGTRNAMPLFNLAWHDSFFWDGRAASLREQALMPIEDAHEMNESLPNVVRKLTADTEYPALFEKAFGTPEINAGRIGLALEQFLLTLVSQDSKFDRAARGEAELSDAEKRGLQLFVTEYDPKRNLRGADCFHCHGGNLFTTHQFFNNGLDLDPQDLGRYLVTGNDGDKGKFKAPSLRNVAVTGPYMHDGRFRTLEEVIEHYDRGVKPSATLDPNLAKHPAAGLALSPQDKADLVAFLKSLTDTAFLDGNPGPTTRTNSSALAP